LDPSLTFQQLNGFAGRLIVSENVAWLLKAAWLEWDVM
jgi:hypothetical protein